MCVVDMVETIISEWDATDRNDIEAACARHFPRAMRWETVSALSLAEDVRRKLGDDERVMVVGCVEDPRDVRDITLPRVKLRFINYTPVA